MLLCALLLSALAAGFASAAGEKVDLKLNLTAGKTYRTRMVNDQKMKTAMQGREVDMTNQQTMDMALAVQSVTGGLATVAITYERIASIMETPGGTLSFDSAEPAETQDPRLKILAAMAGSGFTLVTDQHGEVKELRGVQEMLDRMFDSIESENEQVAEALKAQFAKMYGEEGSKAMMGQVFGMLPPGPVAVGDIWTKTVELAVLGQMKTETSYTLNSVDGGKAVIGVQSTFEADSTGEGMDMGSFKVKMQMAGEQNGTIEIDLATGLVTGGSSVFKASGVQKIQGGEGPMKDASMPIDMEVTTSWHPL